MGFVLGGGGGEDVVWGLFWGVVLGRGLFGLYFGVGVGEGFVLGGGGCFGFVVGGGVFGEGLQGMIMKAEHQ